MSDHDDPLDPSGADPMDKAYAEAEAVLSDEAARAARRARVLAGVARDAEAPAAAPGPAPRPAWRRGGWLVAAGVAGLSVLVAIQVYPPAPTQRQPAPTAPAATHRAGALSPAPAVRPPAPAAKPVSRGYEVAPKAVASPPPEVPAAALPSAPPPPAPQPPTAQASEARPAPPPISDAQARGARPAPPPPPPPAAASIIQELVVTSEKRAPAGSRADRAENLRAAAAAGRTEDVAALLAKRVPVDAADDEGETALMKAIQADHPAAAALLRRHGASLDRKSHEGVSARDMAKTVGDAELDQALGLRP